MGQSEPGDGDREVSVRAATSRERIRNRLRSGAATVRELAEFLETDPHTVLDDLEHVRRSLRSTESEFLVRPPTCRECGFAEFDDKINLPSRCPVCRSERIREPAFKIDGPTQS